MTTTTTATPDDSPILSGALIAATWAAIHSNAYPMPDEVRCAAAESLQAHPTLAQRAMHVEDDFLLTLRARLGGWQGEATALWMSVRADRREELAKAMQATKRHPEFSEIADLPLAGGGVLDDPCLVSRALDAGWLRCVLTKPVQAGAGDGTHGTLIDADTGEPLRPATLLEARRGQEAAQRDGVGLIEVKVIEVTYRRCYVAQ